MDRHLVAVEVGIKGGARQWMQLDGLALHQHRVKGLNAQTVEGRGTIEHNRVILDNFFQNVPYLGALPFNQFLGRFHRLDVPLFLQLHNNEGLEQLHGHVFRQTTLVKLQLRPDDNNRAAGIINAFTKEVLTETALLSLQQVGE